MNNPLQILIPAIYAPPLRQGDKVKVEYISATLIDDGKPERTAGGFATGVSRRKVYRARKPQTVENAARIYISDWGTYGPEIDREEVIFIEED